MTELAQAIACELMDERNSGLFGSSTSDRCTRVSYGYRCFLDGGSAASVRTNLIVGELGVRTVAIRRRTGALAGTQIGFAVRFGAEHGWRELGASVRAVTKGLVLRLTACTPRVLLTCIQRHWNWGVGGRYQR